jgi:hypothetical protein
MITSCIQHSSNIYIQSSIWEYIIAKLLRTIIGAVILIIIGKAGLSGDDAGD